MRNGTSRKEPNDIRERLDHDRAPPAPRAMPLELIGARATLRGGAERVFDLDEPILAAPADERVGLAPVLGHEVEPRSAEPEPPLAQRRVIPVGAPGPSHVVGSGASCRCMHAKAWALFAPRVACRTVAPRARNSA